MKNIITAVLAILTVACTSVDSGMSAMRPSCPEETSQKSLDYIYDLWSCGKRDEAEIITLEGARNNNEELAMVYLQIRASQNDLYSGLIFAIKGAEEGNIEMAKWVMRANQSHPSNTLTKSVNNWFYRYFKEADEHAYVALSEFLDYATLQAKSGNTSVAIYGLAFADARVGLFSQKESENISTKQAELKKVISAENINSVLAEAKAISHKLQDN
jgi:hypothetical protein